MIDLSPREEEVLSLVVQAHTAKEIGRMLGISDRTVERHSINIRTKLNARSIVDMVRIALTVRRPRQTIEETYIDEVEVIDIKKSVGAE